MDRLKQLETLSHQIDDRVPQSVLESVFDCIPCSAFSCLFHHLCFCYSSSHTFFLLFPQCN
jgi:hypothetical protein